MNLYKVTLSGFGGSRYRESYAVASNAEAAYQAVKKGLEISDIGREDDRKMKSVEMLAEKDCFFIEGELS